MATHPPIPDRIRAIDPAWDGKFPPLKPEQVETVKRAAISELEHTRPPMPQVLGAILGGAVLIADDDAPKPPVIRTHSVLPNLGNPTPLHLKYAEQLRDALPDNLRQAAREPLDGHRVDLRAAFERRCNTACGTARRNCRPRFGFRFRKDGGAVSRKFPLSRNTRGCRW